MLQRVYLEFIYIITGADDDAEDTVVDEDIGYKFIDCVKNSIGIAGKEFSLFLLLCKTELPIK